jgi:LPXTG-site transpeptidase (sortase) family protein
MRMQSAAPSQAQDRFLFVVIFVWVFAGSLFLLNTIGYVPYYIDGTVPTVSDTATLEQDVEKQPEDMLPVAIPELAMPVLPERIRIPSLDRDLSIANPTSKDVALLDRALLESVVRYPGSGLLEEDGNVFIFGHSTGYRTVRNQLFKAFNGIQNLEEGSIIELIAEGSVYIYQVTKVTKTDAEDALVDLSVTPGVRRLTLSTCDSFGAKSSRFVVEAAFVTKVPESSTDTLDSSLQ